MKDELSKYLGTELLKVGEYKGFVYQIRRHAALTMFKTSIDKRALIHCGYIKHNEQSEHEIIFDVMNEVDEVTFDHYGYIGFDTGHYFNTIEDCTFESVESKIKKIIDVSIIR